jgi:hypothetical protein
VVVVAIAVDRIERLKWSEAEQQRFWKSSSPR